MKKIIAVIIVLFLSNQISSAQVTQLTIGVDGFTCSLCAKGVEEQFKSLDFVKSVKTDLKNTLFVLSIKNSPKINISQIRDAVSDGGFSVRDITVEAEGTIRGDQNSGYILSTPNTPDIQLKDVKEELSDGDKVLLKGTVNSNSIHVTSIKKI
ncbi:MAG: heavy-metal-associated domain-containing protein [Ignavibacteria bacterium]|nr:heavy-metal-associated domain-containing protein [Ignavibacteria bacterium]